LEQQTCCLCGPQALTKFIKEHAKVPYELPKKQEGDGEQKDEL